MRVDLANWGQIKGQTGGGPSGANIPMPQGQRPHGESQPLEAENIQKLSAIEQHTAKKWEGIFQGFGKTINEWDKQANALSLKKLEGHLQTSMLKFRMGLAKEFQGLTDDEMKPKNVMQLIPKRVDQFLTDFEKSDEVAQILKNDDVNKFWQAGRPTAANKFVEMALPAWQTDFSNREKAATNTFEEAISTTATTARLATIFPDSDTATRDMLMRYTGQDLDTFSEPGDLKAAADLAITDYVAYLKESGKPQIVIDQMVFQAHKQSEHNYLKLLKTFPKGSLDKIMPKSVHAWYDAFPHADKAEVAAVHNDLVEIQEASAQKTILSEFKLRNVSGVNPIGEMKYQKEHLPDSLAKLKLLDKRNIRKQDLPLFDLTEENYNKYRYTLLETLRKREEALKKITKEDRAIILKRMQAQIVAAQSDDPDVARNALLPKNLVWNDPVYNDIWNGLPKEKQQTYITTVSLTNTFAHILNPLTQSIDPKKIQSIPQTQHRIALLKPNTADFFKNLSTLIKDTGFTTDLDVEIQAFLNDGTINDSDMPTIMKLYGIATNELSQWHIKYKANPITTIRQSISDPNYIENVSIGNGETNGNITLNGIKYRDIQTKLAGGADIRVEFLPEDWKADQITKIEELLEKPGDAQGNAPVNIPEFYKYITNLKNSFLTGDNLSPADVEIGKQVFSKFIIGNVPAGAYAAWKIKDSKDLVQYENLPTKPQANLDVGISQTLNRTSQQINKDLNLILGDGPFEINGTPVTTASQLRGIIGNAATKGIQDTTGWFFKTLSGVTRTDFVVGDPADGPFKKLMYNQYARLDASRTDAAYIHYAPSIPEQWAISNASFTTPAYGGLDSAQSGYNVDGLVDLVAGHIAHHGAPKNVSAFSKTIQAYMEQLTQAEIVVPVTANAAIRIPREDVPDQHRGLFSSDDIAFALNQVTLGHVGNGVFVINPEVNGIEGAQAQAINALLKDAILNEQVFIAPKQVGDGKFAYYLFTSEDGKPGFKNSFPLRNTKGDGGLFYLNMDDVYQRAADKNTLMLIRSSHYDPNAITSLPGIGSDIIPMVAQGGAVSKLARDSLIDGGLQAKNVYNLKDKKWELNPDAGITSVNLLDALLAADDEFYTKRAKNTDGWSEKKSFAIKNRSGETMWKEVMKGAPSKFYDYNEIREYVTKRLVKMEKEYSKKFINTRESGVLAALTNMLGFSPLEVKDTPSLKETLFQTPGGGGSAKELTTEVEASPTPIVQEGQVQAAAIEGDIHRSLAEGIVTGVGIQAWGPDVSYLQQKAAGLRIEENKFLGEPTTPIGEAIKGSQEVSFRDAVLDPVTTLSSGSQTDRSSITSSSDGPAQPDSETIGVPMSQTVIRKSLRKTEPIDLIDPPRTYQRESGTVLSAPVPYRKFEQKESGAEFSEAVPYHEEDIIEHRVVRGDTLHKLALRFKTSVTQIMLLNPLIKEKHKIKTGQIIKIPPPSDLHAPATTAIQD